MTGTPPIKKRLKQTIVTKRTPGTAGVLMGGHGERWRR